MVVWFCDTPAFEAKAEARVVTSSGDGSVIIDGQPLDLSHLRVITRQVAMDLPGGFRKVVRADFHFSCHCYSRSPRQLVDGTFEAIPPGRLVPDGPIRAPRPRIFCPDRYALSGQLVACIDAMIESNGIVTRTQHVNYFHLPSLTHAVPGIPDPADYYVFFGLRIVKPANQPKQFRIHVESAYVGAKAHGRVSSRFSDALGLEWAGQTK